MKLKNKMRKIPKNSLLLLLLMFIPLCVLGDAAPPGVPEYEIIITNKKGAYCYERGDDNGEVKYKKTNKIIPFGTVLTTSSEAYGNYIWVSNDNDCDYLNIKDVNAKNDKFDVNQDDVSKIATMHGIILAKSGLNMRKGPSVAYDRILTIPQYSIVTLKYSAGAFWYYVEYNGKSGWINGMNQYLGKDSNQILYSYKDIKIYSDSAQKNIIGTIPALTEITDYVELVYGHYENNSSNEVEYYVNYNGVKGYIGNVYNEYITYKVDGKIELLVDTNLYNINGQFVKKIEKGKILDYSIYYPGYEYGPDYEIFYIPSENGYIKFDDDLSFFDDDLNFKMVKDEIQIKKTKGYIGEGLFGEKKDVEISNLGKHYFELAEQDDKNNSSVSTKPIEEPIKKPVEYNHGIQMRVGKNNNFITSYVLGSVLLALTIVIIIVLVNHRKIKKEVVMSSKKQNDEPKQDEKGDENEIKEQNEENTKE